MQAPSKDEPMLSNTSIAPPSSMASRWNEKLTHRSLSSSIQQNAPASFKDGSSPDKKLLYTRKVGGLRPPVRRSSEEVGLSEIFGQLVQNFDGILRDDVEKFVPSSDKRCSLSVSAKSA